MPGRSRSTASGCEPRSEIRELAGSDEHVGEVRILKARLALLEEELAQLRGLLGTLSLAQQAAQTIPLRTA